MRSWKAHVKRHQTTPKLEVRTIITAEKDEAALARKYYRAPKRAEAAQQQQQQQQSEHIHTCVYKRGRFPQTLDLWRNSARMDYRVGRVSLHALSMSRSPGCRGYISWSVFIVSGGISFFFFVLYFERTRPTASTWQPCLKYFTPLEAARPTERSEQGRFWLTCEKATS